MPLTLPSYVPKRQLTLPQTEAPADPEATATDEAQAVDENSETTMPSGNEVQKADEQQDEDGDDQTVDAEPTPAMGSGMNNMGDFNQMQMMMAMQNGMAPNSFGGMPMMGESFSRTPQPPQQRC